MIKLIRGPHPSQLTNAKVKELTNAYTQNGDTSVWKKSYIRDSLLQMSSNKCCYCECNVTTEGKYMEVDHFHDKSTYPEEVVIWENLLPSCKRCNGNKGDYNTKINLFINPSVDEPREHMKLIDSVVYEPKDQKGENTIRELKINDSERLCTARVEVKKTILSQINSINKSCRLWLLDKQNADMADIQKEMIDFLCVCAPGTPYSAVKATCVLHNDIYKSVKNFMQEHDMWTEEMQSAEQRLEWSRYDLETIPISQN